MKSVDRLVKEHDLIERGLNVLEQVVARIESNQSVPEDFPRWAPEFFRQFGDKCHHAKKKTYSSLCSKSVVPVHSSL